MFTECLKCGWVAIVDNYRRQLLHSYQTCSKPLVQNLINRTFLMVLLSTSPLSHLSYTDCAQGSKTVEQHLRQWLTSSKTFHFFYLFVPNNSEIGRSPLFSFSSLQHFSIIVVLVFTILLKMHSGYQWFFLGWILWLYKKCFQFILTSLRT